MIGVIGDNYPTQTRRVIEMKTIFDSLVQVKKDKFGTWHFDCPIGLWGVSGKDKLKVSSEAQSYFHQYLSDGEYDKLAERYGITI